MIDFTKPMGMEEISKLQEAMRIVFTKTEEGMLVFEYLKLTCFATISTLGSTPEQTAANEGSRRVFLSIENLMSLDIDQIKKMYQETGGVV